MQSNTNKFLDLDDDVIIHICKITDVPTVLGLRGSSKRFLAVTRLLAVWRVLLQTCVVEQGFPFPPDALHTTDSSRLEHLVRRACHLGSYWLSSPAPRPRLCRQFDTFSKGTGISEIAFLPGFDRQRIVTVSKGIWSVVSCWDLGLSTDPGTASWEPRKIAEWAPKSVILTGFSVNVDADGDGVLAIAMDREGGHSIEIFTLQPSIEQDGLPYTLACLQKIETICRPMAFHGDILAVCDDSRETHIVNWKTAQTAVLQCLNSGRDGHNKCLQVLLTEHHVLVVRVDGTEVYPYPELLPPPPHSSNIVRPTKRIPSGWADGISMVARLPSFPVPALPAGSTSYPPISVVKRSEMEFPWPEDKSTIVVQSLEPDVVSELTSEQTHTQPHFPYRRSELITTLTHTSQRYLRCSTILSGRYGTAIWIHPPQRSRTSRDVGLATFDVHSSLAQGLEDAHTLANTDTAAQNGMMLQLDPLSDTVVGALLLGPLRSAHKEPSNRMQDVLNGDKEYGLRRICTPDQTEDLGGMEGTSYWTSMDYAEEWGRIVLGSSNGKITFIEL